MASPPLGTKFEISLPASISKGAKSRNAAPNTALRTKVRVGGLEAGAGDGVARDDAKRLDTVVISRRSCVSLLTVKSL